MSGQSNDLEYIKVIVRCRPMKEKEIQDGYQIVDIDTKCGVVSIKKPAAMKDPPKELTFQKVYDWNSKQTDLYEETFRELVDSVLNGFNDTVFAYGQTGTGKTFTMQGVKDHPELRGMMPNSFEQIFQHISRSQNQQYLVSVSYIEIHQEEIHDLLSKDQSKLLELKERPDTGVYIKDLTSIVIKSVEEIEHLLEIGNHNRSVWHTSMGCASNRSTAIFTITIECSETGVDNENHFRVGKLNLVDLAGSERQSKTRAEGQALKEATKIGLSLSSIGNVITALTDPKSKYIPYRDSKVMRLLRDSLGGTAKTVMVANIGPSSHNFDETISTLRYANRAKGIQNRPKINEDPKETFLRDLKKEIARLKAYLDRQGDRAGGEMIEVSDEEDDPLADVEDYEKQQTKLEEEKQLIMSNERLPSSEKNELLSKVQERVELLRQQLKEDLSKKIEAQEEKILSGGTLEGATGFTKIVQ